MCHFKINKDHQSDLGRQSGLVLLHKRIYFICIRIGTAAAGVQPTCTDVMVLKSISMHIRSLSLSFYSLKLSKTVETIQGCAIH